MAGQFVLDTEEGEGGKKRKKEKNIYSSERPEKLPEEITEMKTNAQGDLLVARINKQKFGRKSIFDKKIKIEYGSKQNYRRHPENINRDTLKKEIRSKKVRKQLEKQQKIYEKAVENLADAEILLPDTQGFVKPEGLERTFKYTQSDLLKNVDRGTKKKIFDLSLSYGAYIMDFETNGRHLLFAGRKGTLAMMDMHTMNSSTDINVHETIRDIKFLHNYTLFAAAQKKYTYVYDNRGIEIHCLRDITFAYQLEFLPFHFLLVSIGEFGQLRYLDVSTGEVVCRHNTGKGACDVMRQNKKDATIFLGHRNGNVTIWTPNSKEAVVKMLCHKGPIRAIDIYNNYLVTAGGDGSWRIWDMRKYEQIESVKYFGRNPSSIDISQNGHIGISFGPHIQIWNNSIYSNYMYYNNNNNNDILNSNNNNIDACNGDGIVKFYNTSDNNEENKTGKYILNEEMYTRRMPLLTHDLFGREMERVRFCPYEDILCVGHTNGISTILAPGTANANFDSFYFNPYQTNKQRRENEVHRLLEKLDASMISLNTNLIGNVDDAPKHIIQQEAEQRLKEKEEEQQKKKKQKNKKRGRNDAENRVKKQNAKAANASRIEAKKRLEEKEKKEKENNKKNKQSNKKEEEKEGIGHVLDRFRRGEKPVYT